MHVSISTYISEINTIIVRLSCIIYNVIHSFCISYMTYTCITYQQCTLWLIFIFHLLSSRWVIYLIWYERSAYLPFHIFLFFLTFAHVMHLITTLCISNTLTCICFIPWLMICLAWYVEIHMTRGLHVQNKLCILPPRPFTFCSFHMTVYYIL